MNFTCVLRHRIRNVIPVLYSNSAFCSSSSKDSGNDDFFTSFKKRVEEEAKKENVDIKALKIDGRLNKLKNNFQNISDRATTIFKNTGEKLSDITSVISATTARKYETLNDVIKRGDNQVTSSISKLIVFYKENVKNKIPSVNKDTRTYKFMSKFYDETLGVYFNNVPIPYIGGKSEKLEKWTQELSLIKSETSPVTRIVPVQRRYLKWFLHDYLMDVQWINRTVHYVATNQNEMLTRLCTAYTQSRDSFKYLLINKDYIETHRNIFLFHNNFTKEDFMYKWENIIIPGVLEAILLTRNFDLLKKWMTPECHLLVSSSNDFFASVKTEPLILDVYDADIFDMKRVEKSSSSLIFVRFSIIYTFNEIGDANTGKKPKFNEGIINWAIQTDPDYVNNDLGFKIADLGNTIAKLYGFEK